MVNGLRGAVATGDLAPPLLEDTGFSPIACSPGAGIFEPEENPALILAGQFERAGDDGGIHLVDPDWNRRVNFDELIGKRVHMERATRRVAEQNEMLLPRAVLERHHPAGNLDLPAG